MHKGYESETVEQSLAHLAEELAEAMQAVAKSLRFGPLSVNPELLGQQETNFVWMRREMVDIAQAYRALDTILATEGHIEEGELTGELIVELG